VSDFFDVLHSHLSRTLRPAYNLALMPIRAETPDPRRSPKVGIGWNPQSAVLRAASHAA
jgi:hypothetical protein